MFAFAISFAILLGLALIITAGVKVWRAFRRRAGDAGYASLGAYLRATPRSEEEKKDAVDLTLTGVVICILGLVFPPLLLIGIIPLYYGARKLAYSVMGFGLFHDAEPPTE